jgi:hypothetical protein
MAERIPINAFESTLGSECNLLFGVDSPAFSGDAVAAAIGGESGPDAGRLLADEGNARLTAQLPGRAPVRTGGRVELAIDPSQLHLFDDVSGDALPLQRVSQRA